MEKAKKRLVVLGGGFAGLQFVRHLIHSDYDITLIDRFNYHQFQPLFYQVATARIEPSNISFPLRKVFQNKKNVHYRLAEVEQVLPAENKVKTNIDTFEYDYLVIATGCTTNFFGNKEIEKLAWPMKSTPEALAVRNRILLNFEDALSAVSPEEMEGLMNLVVVGGGPTGVELAGALAEMKTNILPKDYPDMDFSKLNVYLLEGGPVLLPPMSEISQKKSKEYLEEMGVKVWVNSLVQEYDGNTATLKDGRTIATKNLIWAAGVTGNLPGGFDPSIVQRGNRLPVDRYNKVTGFENIFAVGDIAYMETPKYPKGHPQVANVAINQAKLLGKNFRKSLVQESWEQFEYHDPGTMATVGKRKAVVDLPKFSFQGRLAWLAWMFLHLMLILSVRNKLFIFIHWAISYFSNDTTLRLILLPTKKQIDLAKAHIFKMPEPFKKDYEHT